MPIFPRIFPRYTHAIYRSHAWLVRARAFIDNGRGADQYVYGSLTLSRSAYVTGGDMGLCYATLSRGRTYGSYDRVRVQGACILAPYRVVEYSREYSWIFNEKSTTNVF